MRGMAAIDLARAMRHTLYNLMRNIGPYLD